jgi:hypothetical protein
MGAEWDCYVQDIRVGRSGNGSVEAVVIYLIYIYREREKKCY